MADNTSKDNTSKKKSPKQKSGGKGFTTAQERSRKHINVTVAVIVAAMAVIGIVGMALKTPDTSAGAASAAAAASTQKEAVTGEEAAVPASETAKTAVSAAETVVAQSPEKTTDETAAAATAGTTDQAQTENTAGTAATAESTGLALREGGTYTLPENMNVYSQADASGPVIAALYAGNQVQVGQDAGNGWYSVTVWVGSGGSYTQTTGYMKLQ